MDERPTTASRPALLVFADDWGRHPSSCQHLIRQLLPRYEVWWVNTIGTRAPGLDLATVARGMSKLAGWLTLAPCPTVAPTGLNVVNPLMWPWFSRPRDRRWNRRLLQRKLEPLIRAMPAPPVAVTTLPIVADLMGSLPVARWVYYCVDDYHQWPGLDQRALAAMEEQVVERCDVLMAVSDPLRERFVGMGKQAHLLTHGVDLSHWQANGQSAAPVPLDGMESPYVVFWGLIDRRMDVDMVRRTADAMDRGRLLMVGPELNPDAALWSHPRVVRVGPLAYNQLPQLARQADVLIMPYADLPATRAMQPLKLKEYLATGKPVVVRDLPATRPWADCLDVAATAEEFAAAVRRRLEAGLPEGQRAARARLADETWSAKARQFEQLVLQFPLVNQQMAAATTWRSGNVNGSQSS